MGVSSEYMFHTSDDEAMPYSFNQLRHTLKTARSDNS